MLLEVPRPWSGPNDDFFYQWTGFYEYYVWSIMHLFYDMIILLFVYLYHLRVVVVVVSSSSDTLQFVLKYDLLWGRGAYPRANSAPNPRANLNVSMFTIGLTRHRADQLKVTSWPCKTQNEEDAVLPLAPDRNLLAQLKLYPRGLSSACFFAGRAHPRLYPCIGYLPIHHPRATHEWAIHPYVRPSIHPRAAHTWAILYYTPIHGSCTHP